MREKIAQNLLEKVKNDYAKIAEEFDQTRKNRWQELRLFLPYIEKDSYLVDLGCGNGRLYGYLKLKKRDVKYLGIDNNEPLIQKAKENYPEVKFLVGDLLNIPLKTGTVDVATSIAVLHHIPSKKFRLKAVKEMHRILRKDGKLIIRVWNLFQPKYKKYIWKARIKSLLSLGRYDSRDTFVPWANSGVNRYIYAFKEREIKSLLRKCGFRIIKKNIGRNLLFICKKK